MNLSRAFLALPLFLLGCPSSEKDTDDTGDTDVDTDPTGDTDPTDETDPQSPDFVEVVVEAWVGQPDAEAVVLFHDPDGQVVGVEATDANGRASFELPDGGAVTVVSYYHGLVTFFGIASGDELVLDASSTLRPEPEQALDLQIPVVPGSALIWMDVGCGWPDYFNDTNYLGGTRTVAYDSWCVSPEGTVDALVTVYGFEGDKFLYALDADPAEPVFIGDEWRTDWAETLFTLKNVGSNDYLDAAVDLWRGDRFYGTFSDDDPWVIDGGKKLTPYYPPGFADRIVASAWVNRDQTGNIAGTYRVYEGSEVEAFTLDADTLPDAADTVTVTKEDERWVVAWNGDALAVTAATIGFRIEEGGWFVWSLVAPGDLDRVVLPELPEDLFTLPDAPNWAVGEVIRTDIEGIGAREQLLRYNAVPRHLDVGRLPVESEVLFTLGYLAD